MLQRRYEFILFPNYFITVVYYYRTHPILFFNFFPSLLFYIFKIFSLLVNILVLTFFAQRHLKVAGFTMTCLAVLVNIADVNADLTCHLTNFWLLPPWPPHVSVLEFSPFWMLE